VSSGGEKQRTADDRLGLFGVIFGGAIAFLARRDPMGLATGLALGLAGALIALRGERPIAARNWLRAALAVAVLAFAARYALEVYQEWIVAQWFAEGNSGVATQIELERMTKLGEGLRIFALASSLGMLLGGAVQRMK
jgi:hypothetical protein